MSNSFSGPTGPASKPIHFAFELLKVMPITVVAVIGIYLSVVEYRARQPQVAVGFIDVQLRSVPTDYTDITAALHEIEDNYGDITGNVVIKLIDSSEELGLGGVDETTRFILEIEEGIQEYNSISSLIAELSALWQQISAGQIELDDIVQKLNSLEQEYVDVSGAELILLILDSSSVSHSGDGLDALVTTVDTVISNLEVVDTLVPLLNRKLSQIRESVENIKDNADYRLYVEASIENRSRIATVIRERATMRLWRDSGTPFTLTLHAAEDQVIDGIKVEQMQFMSDLMRNLHAQDRAFLEKEFAEIPTDIASSPSCRTTITDMHGNAWTARNSECLDVYVEAMPRR